MLLLEGQARAGLVVHAVLGAATVALTTHLVFWIRRYPWGEFGRHRPAQWFASAALLVYGLQFLVGNVIYPVYKVRVRLEYFENPTSIARDVEARTEARAQTTRRREQDVSRNGGTVVPHPPEPMPAGGLLTSMSRVFDVKEHWAALGLALSAGACLLAWTWNPRRDGAGGAALLVATSVLAAASAWIAALIGLVVTSVRAIGGPG